VGQGVPNDLESGRLCGHCFTEDTRIVTPDGRKDIEDIRVGDRILATNLSQSAQDGATEVNPETWRKLTFWMPDPEHEGGTINLELLKPLSWIEEAGAGPGA
jgi:hypothetical protein